jgi:hypothetical protein
LPGRADYLVRAAARLTIIESTESAEVNQANVSFARALPMSQTTEAACLLQSGSMYARRLGLKTNSGQEIFAGVKPGAVSLYFGDAPIYHFDLDGRWQRAFVNGTHYLKGLDTTVRSIDRERESGAMVLLRETLPDNVKADLDASIRSVALGLIEDLDSARLEVLPPPAKAVIFTPEEFRSFLERVVHWDLAGWSSLRKRYEAAYGPLSFMPPDCPNALILQATLGHAGGRAFGGAPPVEHYVRSSGEFLKHARAVGRLVSFRVAQLRRIFLGGADLLHCPLADVLDYLGTIGRVFAIGPERPAKGNAWNDFPGKLGTVHAFLDDFSDPLPDLEGWQQLRAAHLGHVTLGVESGDAEIRASFGKDWQSESLRTTVEKLKEVGIGVGMVFLVGAGGRAGADRHVEATSSLLHSLPLGRADLVSLVDVRTLSDSSGEGALSDEETAAQVAAIKARSSKGPKVVVYNPLKRWA